MFFKRKKEEFNLEDTIPEHEKETAPADTWDEFSLENFNRPKPKKEESAPAPPISDFFTSVPDAPLPSHDPLLPQPKEEQLPPPVSSSPRGEITRVDVELILSKLENIDHRLRWIEDQLRRRGTI